MRRTGGRSTGRTEAALVIASNPLGFTRATPIAGSRGRDLRRRTPLHGWKVSRVEERAAVVMRCAVVMGVNKGRRNCLHPHKTEEDEQDKRQFARRFADCEGLNHSTDTLPIGRGRLVIVSRYQFPIGAPSGSASSPIPGKPPRRCRIRWVDRTVNRPMCRANTDMRHNSGSFHASKPVSSTMNAHPMCHSHWCSPCQNTSMALPRKNPIKATGTDHITAPAAFTAVNVGAHMPVAPQATGIARRKPKRKREKRSSTIERRCTHR